MVNISLVMYTNRMFRLRELNSVIKCNFVKKNKLWELWILYVVGAYILPLPKM